MTRRQRRRRPALRKTADEGSNFHQRYRALRISMGRSSGGGTISIAVGVSCREAWR